MNRKRYTLLLAAITLISAIFVMEVNAKNLNMDMDISKPSTGPAYPEAMHLTWGGTVSGDINGRIYFYKLGHKVFGNNKHFWEVWMITDESDGMLLMGIDKGAIRLSNMKFWMKGEVANAAPDYAYLIGRTIRIRGSVISLSQASGTFRVTHMPRRLE